MNFEELKSQRIEYNSKCIELLKSFLNDNQDMRIEQILFILDIQKDYFYEEPIKTFARWTETINKAK